MECPVKDAVPRTPIAGRESTFLDGAVGAARAYIITFRRMNGRLICVVGREYHVYPHYASF